VLFALATRDQAHIALMQTMLRLPRKLGPLPPPQSSPHGHPNQ
jgi:hypothetical protein